MHKRHISQLTGILVTIFLFSVVLASASLPAAEASNPANNDPQAVVELINDARSKAGVSPLTIGSALSAAATAKARAMANSGYLSNTMPVAGSDYKMSGSTVTGESWARSDSAVSACQLLSQISALKRTMLDNKFNRVGIGIAPGNSNTLLVLVFKGGTTEPAPVPKPVPQPVPQPQPQPLPQPQPEPGQPVQGLSADEQRMFNLVNSARASAGLRPLQIDMTLVKLARLKAQDMINKNYFSHTSPTYGSPFDMMRSYGVSYRYAGENLAGAPTVDSAHTNLMNSPGHRANILNSNFTKVGIGVVSGGPYGKMFVQMFTG